MPIPMLKRLFLRGFRSFPAAVVEFDNPTFLVGQNGAGKSNLADAFAFLSEAMTSPLSTVFSQRVGYAAVSSRSAKTRHPLNLGMKVLDVLWNAKCFMQVIVTTHSPDILEAKWIEDNHLRVVTWNEGSSQVAQASDDTREAIREQLMDAGELMRSGTLFASPVDDLFSQSPNKVPLFKGGPS